MNNEDKENMKEKLHETTDKAKENSMKSKKI